VQPTHPLLPSSLLAILMLTSAVASEAQPRPPAAQPAAPVACVPACRSGYMCYQGQCVSACNPPCAANERCTENAQCVLQAPAPVAPAPIAPVGVPSPAPGAAPAGAAPPAGAPPPWPGAAAATAPATGAPAAAPAAVAGPAGVAAPSTAVAPSAGAEAGASTAVPPPLFAPGLIFHPQIGILLTGSGDYNYDDSYSGSTTLTPSPKSTSGDDKSGVALGVELLGAVSPTVRLGGGILWVPSMKASIEGTELKAGNQLMLAGIVEPVFPVSPTVGLAIRGQVGIGLLFAGGDLQNAIDDEKSSCAKDLAAGDPKCDVNEGPSFGWNLGGGGGVIAAAGGRVRLRADLLVQYMSQGLWGYQHTHKGIVGSPEYTHTVDYSVSSTRFWLFAGVEL